MYVWGTTTLIHLHPYRITLTLTITLTITITITLIFTPLLSTYLLQIVDDVLILFVISYCNVLSMRRFVRATFCPCDDLSMRHFFCNELSATTRPRRFVRNDLSATICPCDDLSCDDLSMRLFVRND